MLSIAISSQQAIFQRNQFAEKGDRSITRAGPSASKAVGVLFGDAVERAGRQTSTSKRRSHARCNQTRSGSLPFVFVVQTADFGSHHDAAGRLDGAFHRRILAQREVRARPLGVRDVAFGAGRFWRTTPSRVFAASMWS